MRQTLVFILLSVFLYIQLRVIIRKVFARDVKDHQDNLRELEKLSSRYEVLRNEDSVLLRTAQDTIALYDITKEICKTLDEDKVFSAFHDSMNRYIEFKECKFIRDEAELLNYPQYNVLPLKLNRYIMGYLIADGIKRADTDKFHILSQQFILAIKRALLYRKVQELAIKDGLTEVSSRRYFMERFSEEIQRSAKFKYKFSLLMIDIDHFKKYNDHYGHFVGDAILKEVSRGIRENIRQIDLVGRYGGEEFVVILPDTDRDGALLAAERIRQAIQAKKARVYDEDLEVTISIGLSVFPEDSKESEPLIEKADVALYKAKELGRNRVCVYEK